MKPFLLNFLIDVLSFAVAVPAQLLISCSETAPNPLTSLYPTSVTGTINSTITVVPIPLTLARSIIPSKYGILTEAYRSLLPGFPEGQYPLIVRTGCDHDVSSFQLVHVPDFLSAHFEFPFVDLLHDGYSSFSYNQYLVVDENVVALAGVAQYGGIGVPALFQPASQAYAAGGGTGDITFVANGLTGAPIVSESFVRSGSAEIGPWPLEFYVNVTNQPQFFSGNSCDNQIQLFNTTHSSPTGVQGNISIAAPYLPTASTFTKVYGIQVYIAFIENNGVACASLKGYSGTGSGD